MAKVPGIPSIPGGGQRQQRAAELRAEIERRKREVEQQAEQEGPEETAAQVEEEYQDTSTGPVGEGDYVVKDGECMSSIAKNTGHFWETLWNDPANSEVKEVRKDPNVLLAGDRLTIAELRRKDESGATEQHHRFRRKGEPAKLRLRLMQEPDEQGEDEEEEEEEAAAVSRQRPSQAQEDVPRANVPYTLVVDGESSSGQSDADGYVELDIPGNARRGRLILEPGTPDEATIDLELGHLAPITELGGVRERLNNLGFGCGGTSDELTEDLEKALKAFQDKHGLKMTGKPDQATRDKLALMHGS